MTRPSTKRSSIRPWMVWTVVVIAVAVAAVMSTKFMSLEDAQAAAEGQRFDPTAYAVERFEGEIAPQIEDEAIDLETLLSDLAAGADESEFGNAPGAGSAFSFPVEFTAVAGAPNGSVVPVAVNGVSGDVAVQVQIGPAINGTALRDVTGTVSFNEFTNQLEFQEVATELNTLARDSVLAEIDPATLEGKTIHVVGAYTRVNPGLVSVVPVVLEVQP
jgi:predicted lipoprotein